MSKRKSGGNRCGSCGGVGASSTDGLCKPCRIEREHGPEAKHRYIQSIGKKGAEATAKRFRAFDVDALPAIEGPKDAAAWAEAVAKAVATGRLSNGQGNTVLRAVRDWLAAYETSELVERFEALEQMIEGVVKQQRQLQPNRAVGGGK